jgi:tetratricopeptide (TPR) repeat protein
MNELQEAKMLYSEGKSVKAFKRLENLPATYSTTKVVQCARVNIASGLDAKSYLNVFNEFMSTYPDEPGKYLIPLDGLVTHGYYDLALKCLDSLDDALFADPILNFFRANLCYESGKSEQAVDYLKILLNDMPDFEVGYISLLNIYLAENKYVEATSLLDKIILTFNTYKEDIYPLLANYPEYLNSPLYREWIDQ